MGFLPSSDANPLMNYSIASQTDTIEDNLTERVVNLKPLVRSSLKFVKMNSRPIDYYKKAEEMFKTGELNPEEWNELSVIDRTLEADFRANLSKVKDPYIKMIRESFKAGTLSPEEVSKRLSEYRSKRLSAKARDVLADTQESVYERLEELAILDEDDKQALIAILRIVSSDLSLKEQLLGVASLISNRDMQIIFYLLIIEPKMVIDLVDSMSSAISQVVLKIFIRLIKYIIKKFKSALSFW